jgi:hypothetical protein
MEANVTVTAFNEARDGSYGYRFDTPDRRIVISGDTSPTEETIKACSGCDVLIHDAQTLDCYAKMPERLHSFVTKYHTTTAQLAALATEAKPKLLVTYHTVAFRPGIESRRNFCPLLPLQECPALHLYRTNTRRGDRLAIFRTVRHRPRFGCALRRIAQDAVVPDSCAHRVSGGIPALSH